MLQDLFVVLLLIGMFNCNPQMNTQVAVHVPLSNPNITEERELAAGIFDLTPSLRRYRSLCYAASLSKLKAAPAYI
jgi:hypothetical protein